MVPQPTDHPTEVVYSEDKLLIFVFENSLKTSRKLEVAGRIHVIVKYVKSFIKLSFLVQ